MIKLIALAAFIIMIVLYVKWFVTDLVVPTYKKIKEKRNNANSTKQSN